MSNYQNIELNNFNSDAIKGNLSSNCLNELFFSDLNIEALQLGMKNKIVEETNGKHIIGPQSEIELKIVMRSIYLQYGRNLNEDIVLQVKDLNKKVLDYCVPKILIGIEQYKNYVIDASKVHVPIDRSENVSNKGSKILFRKNLF
jgi:hypothetical protein